MTEKLFYGYCLGGLCAYFATESVVGFGDDALYPPVQSCRMDGGLSQDDPA